MRIWTVILALIFVLGAAGISMAADTLPDSSSRSALDFAKTLAAEGDPVRAAGEVKRFLYFHPNAPEVDEAKSLLAGLEAKIKDQGLDGAWPPWMGSRKKTSDETGTDKDSGAGIALIRFYQEHLRTFRRAGAVCPSHPNCSEYAVQAVRKHGSFLGTFIFVDRYWREVTTVGTPPRVIVNGHEKHYDPLEQNDYWLNKPEVNGQP